MAEDGSSTRGVPGKGCFVGLVLLPLVLLTNPYPTKTRLKLMQLIADKKVQRDAYAHQIRYAHVDSDLNLTARTAEVIRAGWVEDVDKTLKGHRVGRVHSLEGKAAMNGPAHYKEAEELLDELQEMIDANPAPAATVVAAQERAAFVSAVLARAQVHATLALAAATAQSIDRVGIIDTEAVAWQFAVAEVPDAR